MLILQMDLPEDFDSRSNWKYVIFYIWYSFSCEDLWHISYLLLKSISTFYKSSTAWKVSVFEVFLICIFPYSGWIRRDTPYLSGFSPNARNYGPEKLRIRTLSTQCCSVLMNIVAPLLWAVLLADTVYWHHAHIRLEMSLSMADTLMFFRKICYLTNK